MVSHAQNTYPNECCGAMIGSIDGIGKKVAVAVPLENAFAGRAGRPLRTAAGRLVARRIRSAGSEGWI